MPRAFHRGDYVSIGSLASPQVNFDAKFHSKKGITTNQMAETGTSATGAAKPQQVFMVLGPEILNPVGPQWTTMFFEHELEHAQHYLSESEDVRESAGSAGEELAIYLNSFDKYFLTIWTDSGKAETFKPATDFRYIFEYYDQATREDVSTKDKTINRMHDFYVKRIMGVPCNEMKFKIWVQRLLRKPPSGGAELLQEINGLPGMGVDTKANYFDPGLCKSLITPK